MDTKQPLDGDMASPDTMEEDRVPAEGYGTPEVDRHYARGRRKRKGCRLMMRSVETSAAMNFAKRARMNFESFLRSCTRKEKRSSTMQFRIPPKGEHRFPPFRFLTNVFEGSLINWNMWHFRVSYISSVVAFLLVYIVFACLYAFIIRALTVRQYRLHGHECLPGWNFSGEDDKFLDNFYIAFELSWNTFSTVGYGVISPPADATCRGLNYLLATEAFIGVLFGSVCGGIFISKIARSQNTAPVIFSRPICLQFAATATDSEFQVPSMPRSEGSEVEKKKQDNLASFPYLEFRAANKRGHINGSEITDAAIKCMVIFLSIVPEKGDEPHNDKNESAENIASGATPPHVGIKPFDEIRNLKRIYRMVDLNPSMKPHFAQGCWYVRHTLDGSSPFLCHDTRRKIDSLGGWPAEWNNHEAIRKRLSQDIFQIFLIFTGTSSLTTVDVFKTEGWTLEDIYIGWRFASTSFQDKQKSKKESAWRWRDDLTLIHDIVPQKHGLQEPLNGV